MYDRSELKEAPENRPETPTLLEGTAAIDWASRYAWAFVGLGIVVRLIRYLRGFPVWLDEQYLAINILEHDYTDLLRGLEYRQAAPFGFLWVEKALVSWLGCNEWTLRAVSLAASVAGLVAFRMLAGRLLRGSALVAAVGIMSVAYFPIRHSSEFKPYAGDLCAAAVLLLLAVNWSSDPSRLRKALALAVGAVIAMPFSFPSVFVAGGIGLAMVPIAWERRSARAWAGLVGYNAALAAAFAGLYVVALRPQYDRATETTFMYEYWRNSFPPSLAEPGKLVPWLAEAHAGEALAYPIGAKKLCSTPQLLLAIIGAVVLVRRRQGMAVNATLGMLALALVAAALRKYPYAHGERLQQYWAPSACLLIGTGFAVAVERLRSAVTQRRLMRVACGGLVLLAAVSVGQSIVRPYKHRWDREHQLFARWFWRYAAGDTPMICISGDLRRQLYLRFYESPYLVGREMNRPDVPFAGGQDRFASIPPGATIDCVAYQQEGHTYDEEAYQEWMADMLRSYKPVGKRSYRVMIDDKPGKTAHYHVWRFRPLTPASHPSQLLGATPTAIRPAYLPEDLVREASE
jgi:hypothetical protein